MSSLKKRLFSFWVSILVLVCSIIGCSNQAISWQKSCQNDEGKYPAWAVSLHSPGSRVVFDGTANQQVLLNLAAGKGPKQFHIDIFKHTAANKYIYKFTDMQEQLLSSQTYTVDGCRAVSVDLSEYPTGIYYIIVRGDAQGCRSKKWKIQKVPYKENSVLICDGIPYRNGKPFMVIGLYHAGDPTIDVVNSQNAKGVSDKKLTRKEMFGSLKERGFNAVQFGFWTASKEFYQEAADYDLMVLSESTVELDKVFQLREQPNVLGWYNFDEPSHGEARVAGLIYNAYKRIDPYHPVMTAFYRKPAGYNKHRLVDIALADKYCIRNPRSSLAEVTNYVQQCRDVLLESDPTTCVMVVPQLFTVDGYSDKAWPGFEPTYRQIRCNVYAGIAGGAKGVFYYAYYTHEWLDTGMAKNPKRKHWFLPESNLWSSISELNAELYSIKDVILLSKHWEGPKLESSGKAVFRSLILPNGRRYLLVVNPEADKINITVTIADDAAQPTALLDSPTLQAEPNGKWSGVLPGYEVGVYQIK